jgi:hypothetical protein
VSVRVGRGHKANNRGEEGEEEGEPREDSEEFHCKRYQDLLQNSGQIRGERFQRTVVIAVIFCLRAQHALDGRHDAVREFDPIDESCDLDGARSDEEGDGDLRCKNPHGEEPEGEVLQDQRASRNA